MKTILLSISIMLLTSCCGVQPKQTDQLPQIQFEQITTIEYDDCEYLYCRSKLGDIVIEHKGNCKNPIHISKQ